jgi:hypothetical protein
VRLLKALSRFLGEKHETNVRLLRPNIAALGRLSLAAGNVCLEAMLSHAVIRCALIRGIVHNEG